jgi:hypothetical protein
MPRMERQVAAFRTARLRKDPGATALPGEQVEYLAARHSAIRPQMLASAQTHARTFASMVHSIHAHACEWVFNCWLITTLRSVQARARTSGATYALALTTRSSIRAH